MPVTEYTWDSVTDSILEETDGAGSVLSSYTNEPTQYGPLISQHSDGESRYFHFDALGSTRELTDDNEDVTDTLVYDAWGNRILRAGVTDTEYQWIGQWGYHSSSSELLPYVRRRTFATAVARWTTIDRLTEFGEPNLGGSLYWYADNTPVFHIDPSGRITITGIGPFKDSAPCGAELAYRWDFMLSKRARDFCGTDFNIRNSVVGYFVQKVEIWCKKIVCPNGCEDCPTLPDKYGEPAVTFYEAWEVRENDKLAKIRADGSISYTDQFNYAGTNNYCGFRKVVGEVRFFCKKDTGNLGHTDLKDTGKSGGDWGIYPVLDKGDCEASAGQLPATQTLPPFWDGKYNDGTSMSKDGSATHTATHTWKCCNADGSGAFNGNASPKPKS